MMSSISYIRRVVGSAPLRQGASEMAEAMVDEDGTGLATNRLERLVGGEGPSAATRRKVETVN
jgi:hypothetical protein